MENDLAKTIVPKAFGKALQKIRTEKGLNQEDFGVCLGLHRTHISLLERGKRDPKISTVYQIASGLGISIAELVTLLQKEIKA
jgi:transcriptional regulator with XRE-family HTH domain